MFIRDLLTDPKDAVLIGTIMALAHALGFRVVAEGVEELRQIHILQSLDCDVAQGFYFSEALPAARIGTLMGYEYAPGKEVRASRIENVG